MSNNEQLEARLDTIRQWRRQEMQQDGGPFDVDVPLLRKVVEWAEVESSLPKDNRTWDQTWWARETTCGTSMCLAGSIVALDGGEFNFHEGFDGSVANTARMPDGTTCSVRDYARRQLGLTHTEAAHLFASENTIEEIKIFANVILERADDRL